MLLSSPTWRTTRRIFGRTGFQLGSYRYYDPETRSLDVDGMVADLGAAEPGSIVVLHACCHNPTGYELNSEQWDQVVGVVADRGLVPFIDMAYQGFSVGIAEDAMAVEKFVNAWHPLPCRQLLLEDLSGLYGERIGGASVCVC